MTENEQERKVEVAPLKCAKCNSTDTILYRKAILESESVWEISKGEGDWEDLDKHIIRLYLGNSIVAEEYTLCCNACEHSEKVNCPDGTGDNIERLPQ